MSKTEPTEVPIAIVRRSLVSAEIIPGGIALLCDCATGVDLIFDGPIPDGYEDAWICDGCGTAHWYQVIAKDGAE